MMPVETSLPYHLDKSRTLREGPDNGIILDSGTRQESIDLDLAKELIREALAIPARERFR